MVVQIHKSALRLTAVNEAAEREGLLVGMTLADARARTPEVQVMQADPDADKALLAQLLKVCRRYTPALALHPPDGLDLDLTGCAALFGGEDRLLAAIEARMARLGLSLRAALADTPLLAFAIARFAGGGVIASGIREAALAALPVAALRLDPAGCAVLHGLGLRRVGQLLDLPRAALAKRLGEAALDRLDQALGRRADPLEIILERPAFLAERRLMEPIGDQDQVMTVTGDLARDVSVQLQARSVGGRRFVLELFRMDGAMKWLGVATSHPLSASERIAALFAERLAGLNEGLEADFGFDQLRLIAQAVESYPDASNDLLQASPTGIAMADFADRLAARFGTQVRRFSPVDTHTPEGAVRLTGLDTPADWASAPLHRFDDAPLRPLRLFDPPQPIAVVAAEIPEGPPARFTWRRVSRTIVRAEGPERIAPEWGRDDAEALARDYYRLEDEVGRRYWVFRQGDFQAGVEPLWRLHGLFG